MMCNTPLCIAARERNVGVVNILIEKGAKEKMDQALWLADDMQIVTRLRELGA